MLLRNFFVGFSSQVTGNPTGLKYTSYSGSQIDGKKTTSWNAISNLLTFAGMDYALTIINSASLGVVFGDGSTVSFEDHKLSGSVITGISTSVTDNSENSEDRCVARRVYTITNGNDTAITISEIGLYTILPMNKSTTSALVEHTVLESPITIEPGGVGQVTYTITMNYPT